MNRNELRDRLIYDLGLLKRADGWLTAGRPHRDPNKLLQEGVPIENQEPTFNWLFGRDSLITSLMLLPFGCGPAIAKATLKALANLQGKKFNWKSEEQPGKIIHENRDTEYLRSQIPQWEFPYYGSIDATPLFIVLASEYVMRTQDWAFIEDIWQNILAAARWIQHYGDIDGDYFIENYPLNPHGIPNQVWKDCTPFSGQFTYPKAAIVEIQGYAYLAWRRMQWFAAQRGLAVWKEYAENAEYLRANFEREFWLEKSGFYALALDKDKRPIDTVTSNQGQLLLSGILAHGTRRQAVVERLCQGDMWTPFGIRTMSEKETDFDPYKYHQGSIWLHDNWMIWWGMRRYPQFHATAEKLRQNLIETALMLGDAPELHACVQGKLATTDHVSGWGYKPANHIQAWAGAAVLHLLGEEMSAKEKEEVWI